MLARVALALLDLLLLASLAYSAVALLAARRFAARRPGPAPATCPPATILVPLRGAEPEARRIYGAFCQQAYPAYQVVFGVHDADDASVPIVQELMAAYSDRDLQLVVTGEPVAPNPKVENLRAMLAHARYERVVIVDADILVSPDFLARVLAPLAEERIGLVTCLYRSAMVEGLAARLEAMGISGEFAPGVLVAWLTEGMTFALGAVMATRKAVLQAIRGLEVLSPYFADDYQLGHRVRGAGFEVYLSEHVVETVMGHAGVLPMLRHQLRWARATRASRPRGHLGLLVTHGTSWALLALLLGQTRAPGLLLPLLAIVGQCLVVWVVGVRLLGDRVLRGSFWLLPVRDLLGLGTWCASLLGRDLEWRGRHYRLARDGKLVVEVPPGERQRDPDAGSAGIDGLAPPA